MCESGCPSTGTGFTIVELVVVMVLLGILSVAAVSRMLSPSDFAPSMVSNATAAQVRLARLLAMSREDATVQILLSVTDDDWQLQTATDLEGPVRSETIARATTAIVVSNGGFSEPITPTVGLLLRFNSTGEFSAAALGASALDPLLGIRLEITGDSTRILCLYPSGFVLSGDCA